MAPPSIIENAQPLTKNTPPIDSGGQTNDLPTRQPQIETVPLSRTRVITADATPADLVDFLANADRDMHNISSRRMPGVTTQKQAEKELKELAKLKLEAARRLKQDAQATPSQKLEGARGELQALSHLASMHDVRSAQTLETLAKENLKSSDPSLVTDSQMVLIGFAIDRLYNQQPGAENELVELVDVLCKSPSLDVAALLVMGQAREMLAKAGHTKQAQRVRRKIIEKFANSPEPQIAEMAAQLAGNVQYDEIDHLVSAAVSGKEISLARWQEAVATLIKESPDVVTVNYLGGAALEFEALDQTELADATYDALSNEFGKQEDARGEKARIALTARATRKSVIGRTFDPDLPDIHGKPLSTSDFAGKVVLVPFWGQRVSEFSAGHAYPYRTRQEKPR